jgi:hypothetical protein
MNAQQMHAAAGNAPSYSSARALTDESSSTFATSNNRHGAVITAVLGVKL